MNLAYFKFECNRPSGNTLCLIFVIDMTKEGDLEKIEKEYYDKINRDQLPQKIIQIIVGNKLDLESDRKIEYNDIQSFAVENGMLVQEVSSSTGTNIDSLIRQISNKTKFVIKSMPKDKKLAMSQINKDSLQTEQPIPPSSQQSSTNNLKKQQSSQSQILSQPSNKKEDEEQKQQQDINSSPSKRKFDVQDKMKQFTKKRDESEEKSPIENIPKIDFKELQDARKGLRKIDQEEKPPIENTSKVDTNQLQDARKGLRKADTINQSISANNNNPPQTNEFMSKFQKITQKSKQEDGNSDPQPSPQPDKTKENEIKELQSIQKPVEISNNTQEFSITKDKMEDDSTIRNKQASLFINQKDLQSKKRQEEAQFTQEVEPFGETHFREDQKSPPIILIETSSSRSSLVSNNFLGNLKQAGSEEVDLRVESKQKKRDSFTNVIQPNDKLPTIGSYSSNSLKQNNTRNSNYSSKDKSNIQLPSNTKISQPESDKKANGGDQQSTNNDKGGEKQKIKMSPLEMIKLKPIQNQEQQPTSINKAKDENPIQIPTIQVMEASKKQYNPQLLAYLENTNLEDTNNNNNNNQNLPKNGPTNLISSEIIANSQIPNYFTNQISSQDTHPENNKTPPLGNFEKQPNTYTNNNTNNKRNSVNQLFIGIGVTKQVKSDYGDEQISIGSDGFTPTNNKNIDHNQKYHMAGFDDVPDLMQSSISSEKSQIDKKQEPIVQIPPAQVNNQSAISQNNQKAQIQDQRKLSSQNVLKVQPSSEIIPTTAGQNDNPKSRPNSQIKQQNQSNQIISDPLPLQQQQQLLTNFSPPSTAKLNESSGTVNSFASPNNVIQTNQVLQQPQKILPFVPFSPNILSLNSNQKQAPFQMNLLNRQVPQQPLIQIQQIPLQNIQQQKPQQLQQREEEFPNEQISNLYLNQNGIKIPQANAFLYTSEYPQNQDNSITQQPEKQQFLQINPNYQEQTQHLQQIFPSQHQFSGQFLQSPTNPQEVQQQSLQNQQRNSIIEQQGQSQQFSSKFSFSQNQMLVSNHQFPIPNPLQAPQQNINQILNQNTAPSFSQQNIPSSQKIQQQDPMQSLSKDNFILNSFGKQSSDNLSIYKQASEQLSDKISRLSIHTMKTVTPDPLARESVIIQEFEDSNNRDSRSKDPSPIPRIQQPIYEELWSVQRGQQSSFNQEFQNSSHIDALLKEVNNLQVQRTNTQRQKKERLLSKDDNLEINMIDKNIKAIEESIEIIEGDLVRKKEKSRRLKSSPSTSQDLLRSKEEKQINKLQKEQFFIEEDKHVLPTFSYIKNQGITPYKNGRNKSIPVLETTLLSTKKSPRFEDVSSTLSKGGQQNRRSFGKEIITSEFPSSNKDFNQYSAIKSNSLSARQFSSNSGAFIPQKRDKSILTLNFIYQKQKIPIEVFLEDTSFSIAQRFFQIIQTSPSRNSIKKFASIVEEEVNNYCEGLDEIIEKTEQKKFKQKDSVECFIREHNLLTPKSVKKHPLASQLIGQVKINFQEKQLILKIREDDDPDEKAFDFITQHNLPKSKIHSIVQQIVSIQQQYFRKKQEQSNNLKLLGNQQSNNWERVSRFKVDEENISNVKMNEPFSPNVNDGKRTIIHALVGYNSNSQKQQFPLFKKNVKG